MSFFDLFKRKKRRDEEAEFQESEQYENWNDIVYTRENLDIDDPAARREYVENCLQQIAEADREMERLQAEYRVVTSHLRDMEEIDALPPEQREMITRCAMRVYDNENQREAIKRRKSNMTDAEYDRIDRHRDEVHKGLEKFKEAEAYLKKVKADLKRLDQELQAYRYRQEELQLSLINSHKFMIIITVSVAAILIGLFIVGKVFRLEVVYGYIPVAALAIFFVFFLNNRDKEALADKKVVGSAITRLIQLQNRVKIRYVNTRNLIDYECLKYNVRNSRELEELITKYDEENAEKKRIAEAIKQMDLNEKELVLQLSKLRIRDPQVWPRQVAALINRNDEVELRHELIGQRQQLRKRMDYNEQVVAGNARAEIDEIIRQYPGYAQEILDIMDRWKR